jgi:hypothetical protein
MELKSKEWISFAESLEAERPRTPKAATAAQVMEAITATKRAVKFSWG